MGYVGQTYVIPFQTSGLNGNKNIDTIPANGLVLARNVNLHEGGIGTRGGTTKDNETAVTSSPDIRGLYYFRLINGNDFKVFATSAGSVYQNSTTTIKTGMSSSNKFWFETFENELYIVDGASTPQTWDGAAAGTSNITTSSGDWSGSNQPDQIIKHGRGLSERLWAKGVANRPGGIDYSSTGDGKVFSGGTSGKITIETSDGFGITGLIEFGDTLFAFGKRQTWLIDDSDASTANWGYTLAPWTGGVAHHRLLVKTDNDVLAMMEDGEIYSVRSAQYSGDYKKASLVRPAYIDRYIKENILLSSIADFHAVYYPALRAVFWFMVRVGQTECDTALVYFVDRPPEQAWVVHDNTSSNSGYSAACSAIVRAGTGDYELWTGDYSGFLWKLDQSNANDDGNAFYNGFKTPNNALENPRITKHFRRGRVVTEPKGTYSLNVNWWVDGTAGTARTISLSGTGSVFGTGQFGTATFGGEDLIDSSYDLGQVGKRLQQEFYLNTANQEFFVSSDLVDFKPMGALP
jgi:hypothetical protein